MWAKEKKKKKKQRKRKTKTWTQENGESKRPLNISAQFFWLKRKQEDQKLHFK